MGTRNGSGDGVGMGTSSTLYTILLSAVNDEMLLFPVRVRHAENATTLSTASAVVNVAHD